MASTDEALEERSVNEEYKIWKKNCPFLYDLMIVQSLEWPSTTCQWIPGSSKPEDGATDYKVLLGTKSTEENHIMIFSVKVPTECPVTDDTNEFGVFMPIHDKVNQISKIVHEGTINTARVMPHKPTVISTMSSNSKSYIIDTSTENTTTLCGHEAEGFAMCWNNNHEGQLLTGSRDNTVCLWDTTNSSCESPLMHFTGHLQSVNAVGFHFLHQSIFASVSDDKTAMIWDTRSSDRSKASHVVAAHSREVNCVDFNNFSEYVFATCSADSTVALWDLRNLQIKLHSFEGHRGVVNKICWSPHYGTVIASAGSDRRLMIWDLSKIGEEQSLQDSEDGPPELMFMHAGHTSNVTDFSWNPIEPWLIGSVSEDNIMQIWQMAENVIFVDNLGEPSNGE